MRERSAELTNSTGVTADVVVVTFTKQRNLKGYQRRFADPFVVVTDPERALYDAMGFKRGSFWRVWGLRAAKKYAALLRSGRSVDRSTFSREEDKLQLGGDVLVDGEGRVRWIYHGAGPDDRPSVDALISELSTIT